MTNLSPLDKMIADCEARVVALQRQLQDAQIELRALRKARNALCADDAGVAADQVQQPQADRGHRALKRSLKDTWAETLRDIAKRPGRQTTSEDVSAYFEARGWPLTNANLRSQLSTYTERGFLRRIGVGSYQLTDDGLRAVGFDPANVPTDAELNKAADVADPREGTEEGGRLQAEAFRAEAGVVAGAGIIQN